MRSKLALKNMMSSMLYQIVAIICGLITPRLILSSFGSTYNGVISSATQFLNMINILTLGITASTRVELYKSLSESDVLRTSRLVKATKIYMRKVAMILLVYVGLLCLIYPYISHNDLTHTQNATIIAIVSIGTFADYFFGITNNTLLQADQASYVTYLLNTIKITLNTLCVSILIACGKSIYIVKLGSSIVFLLIPIFSNFYVQKKYHLIKDCEPDETGIKGRKSVAFHLISNIVHDNTDLVILTLFTDAKVISVYTVYYMVIGKIKTLMQVLTSGMEAAFGQMWAKKELDALQQNFRAFEYMIFSFTAIAFSCVGILIIPFISLYTEGVTDINYINTNLAVLITIAEGMYCIRQPYLILVYSTGSFDETKWGAAAEAIINVLTSLVLVQHMGICGVIVGTLIANVFRTVQFANFVSKEILHRDKKEVVCRFAWVLVSVLIIVSLSQIVFSMIKIELSWTMWLLEAILVLGIACIVTLIMSLIFYQNDFYQIFCVLKRAIKK